MELKEKVIGNAKNKHVYDKFDAIETNLNGLKIVYLLYDQVTLLQKGSKN